MPQIACGMDGVISVAANFFAKDFSAMVKAALANNFEEARRLHYNMLEGYDLMFAENNPAGVKAFLAYAGIVENYFRLPVVPVSSELHDKINKYRLLTNRRPKHTSKSHFRKEMAFFI
ncbi:dihydrodipicolinate synthase family protein [Chitinophaga sedimenti]|uniref:dihydrodipicolinate synthase family protein n=1 Tax=Chitinophaga sedimenti TaxID=2033606 RepID=UPI0020053AA5|nr:dihydrodipicolinate synthase family protein [Chitinophaga sedimenti]MCK7557087.1 dihydrodipicolinate synthase family protein [Chitinophaga sedimenti]